MKKTKVLLFVLLLMAVILFHSFAYAKNFVVGFVPRAFVSIYFVTMADAVKDEAAKNPNVDVLIISPMDQKDIEGQIRIVEDLTMRKVDLLAVSVNDPKALIPSLNEAQTAGIPVIILDAITPYPGITPLSLIGSNNEDGGEMVGRNVVELSKGKYKVAVLEGVPGQFSNEARLKGFRKIIANHSGIQVVASQPANWQRELAMTTMENMLQAHPDINCVFWS